jgi:hypothetical protein
MRSQIAQVDQANDSNTWQIGGSRFPLYTAGLIYGSYGFGGTQTPASFATPSVPPIYQQAGQFTPMSNQAAQQPYNLKQSPLLWVVGGALVAVLALHYLHWHKE